MEKYFSFPNNSNGNTFTKYDNFNKMLIVKSFSFIIKQLWASFFLNSI